MATRDRNDRGQFTQKVRDQDILKVFDFEATADDPFLTVTETTEALATHFDLDISEEAVRVRLEALNEDGNVARREFGPGVAYRALVGPEPATETTDRSEERQETPRDEFVEL